VTVVLVQAGPVLVKVLQLQVGIAKCV